MELSWAIARLAAQAATITALLRGVSPDQARWRPGPADWSMLEVICHLADEEREDFRARLDLCLHRPGAEWPPIDPQGWVTARAYQQRDLGTALADFAAERQRSLAWLGGLGAPDWQRGERHPAGFTLRAGDLLAAWVAHDLLHTRQLVELHYHSLAAQARPFSPEYAGDW